MNRMIHSAKFWTMILDLVVSLTTYFVTKYAVPEAADDVLFIIGAIQPAVLFVIGAWAYEDGKTSEMAAYIGNPAPADDDEKASE